MPFGRTPKPAAAPGGAMPLVDHLRELRSRLAKAITAILIGAVIAGIFYGPILEFLTQPYYAMRPTLQAEGVSSELVITGIGGAFQFALKICLVFGLLVASPVWLWQLWAFVLPAMHRHEKKWAVILVATGAPLFIGGAVLGYFILPTAMVVLIGFVPDGFGSLVTGAEYFDFIIKMLVVFGVAAEIPLVVIMLNQLGLVSAQQFAHFRPWTVVAIFVFSAIATPTTDPLTMLFLAIPMTALYLIAEIIARLTDRRRRALAHQTSDDEASPLTPDAG